MKEPFVRFDDFELNVRTLELRQSGVPVKLQQQPARVLAVLIGEAGDLVTRETLRKTIWGDETFVDFDRGLNYCISQIRTALGDDVDSPHYLETLRGRGYRFIGKLEGTPAARSRPSTARRVALGVAALVVAVLGLWAAWHSLGEQRSAQSAIGVVPLIAPAGDREWAAAMHAQIVSRLAIASRTPIIDLAHVPESSAHTRWRVEGRVDHSAAQYRVTMLLRDTRDGSVSWSDVFAGTPGDWVDAQSEMADRMAEIIRYRIEGPSAGLPKRRQRLPSRALAKP